MKECKFILPVKDNEGVVLLSQHSALQTQLIIKYGGVTKQNVEGAWLDQNGLLCADQSVQYTVALNVFDSSILDFVEICRKYGKLSRQKAIYYVIDGEATIEDLNETN